MRRLALDEEESEEHIPDTEKSMCEDLAERNRGTLKELKVEAGVSGSEEAHAQCWVGCDLKSKGRQMKGIVKESAQASLYFRKTTLTVRWK